MIGPILQKKKGKRPTLSNMMGCRKSLLRLLFSYLLFVLILENVTSQPVLSSKLQHLTIGGFAATSQQAFMKFWPPVLEGYLNEVVGPQFKPEINFTLIPVDFDASVTSQDLLSAGKKLDFICTHLILSIYEYI